MSVTTAVGTLGSIWRFPVKSMAGEELDEVEVTPGGIVGDRAYALMDRETGKVASAKHPKLWPDMLACRASFLEPPSASDPHPPVRIELADGTIVRSDEPGAEAALSRFFGREVELARAAAAGYTIDQYHPDEEDYDPEGHRDEIVEVALGAAFFSRRGLPSAVPEGSFFDLFPLSVLTSSTLDRLQELQPESVFDARRFRMNFIVDAREDGFVENGWVGRTLALGDAVRLAVAMPDPRCVMPSLAQPGLPRDPRILRGLVRHNRLDIPGGGLFPCAGVYAITASAGTVGRGDEVHLV